MKKLFTLFITLIITGLVTAQSPQKISYQAVIRNASNALIADKTVGLRISILKSSATGNAVYVETQTPKTNANGLVNIDIGGGTVVSGVFSAIDWSSGLYFLKTETDPAGGTSYTITGTSQLLSVPYALHAVRAESVTGQENLDQLRQRVLNLEEIFYKQLPAPSQGLMAFYPFRGNANDFSGNGWDGTVNGATLVTDRFGKTDNAYHFSGTSNISTQFPGVTGSGDRSISFWSKIPAGEAGGSCCFYGSTANGAFFNPGVFTQATPHVHLDISNAYLDCTASNAADGNWHHFVFIFSTQSGTSLNGVSVYYDGELLSGYTGNNFTTYPVNTGTTTKFTIGGKTGATCQMSLDDFRFYNRKLEETEILQLFYESEFAGQAFVNDADGNTYKVVKIGDQVWMAENLRTTRYNDGTAIPYVTDGVAWANLTTPAFCWYNNDIAYKPVYGALYTWYTVATGKLCPAGWHVASEGDWTLLENHLGGYTVAGGKMKEIGTEHWLAPNTDATNMSGFTARPAGWREGGGGVYQYLGSTVTWWTSTQGSSATAIWRVIYNFSGELGHPGGGDPSFGLSVRCIKD